jgi:hypothetical protein
MKRFDSLTSGEGRAQTGRKVTGEGGEPVGTLNGVWIDPSTHRIEFVGVKTHGLSGRTHLVPARNAEIDEDAGLIKLLYSASFVKGAPEFNPKCELAAVQKEQLTAYYACFVPIRRMSTIEEIRPEEAIDLASLPPFGPESKKTRAGLEREEQYFFKQEGFITDAMPEVNASDELERTQRDAESRRQEDA